MHFNYNDKVNKLLLSMLSHNMTMKEAVELCYGDGTFNNTNTSRFSRDIFPRLEKYGFVKKKKGIYKKDGLCCPYDDKKKTLVDCYKFNTKEIALYIDKELFKTFVIKEINKIFMTAIDDELSINDQEIITDSIDNLGELPNKIRTEIISFNLENVDFMFLMIEYIEIYVVETLKDSANIIIKYPDMKDFKELYYKISSAIDSYSKSRQIARRLVENIERAAESYSCEVIRVLPKEKKKGEKLLKGKYRIVPANNKEMIFVKNV